MEEKNMQIGRSVLSTGLVLSVVGWVLPALSAAAPKTAGVVSKTVFERPLNSEDLDAAHFNVDRELGRAWIEVVIIGDYTVDEEPEVVRRPLDGLYYDPARKQVIYRNGAKKIVCAEDSSFLGDTSLKETGQCQLRLSSEKRKVDDGFNVDEETVGKVVFVAGASTR
jgi:hypothetical protein